MYKLIRDNIPKLAKDQQLVVNYAAIQNDEMYIAFLKSTVADDMNIFLQDTNFNVDSLVDAYVAILTLATNAGISIDDIKKNYEESIANFGKFDNRYIAFQPDPTPEDETSTQETEEKATEEEQ